MRLRRPRESRAEYGTGVADSTSVTDSTVNVEVDGQMQPFPMSALPPLLPAQMPAPQLMSGTGTYTCVVDLLGLVADDSGVSATWVRTG
jgi:hypothetical protein